MGTATEFEVDPTNFNNMYAGIKTDYSGGDSSHNGVYRSTNGGDNWQLVNGPWGAIPNAASSVEFAIAPSIAMRGSFLLEETETPTPFHQAIPIRIGRFHSVAMESQERPTEGVRFLVGIRV